MSEPIRPSPITATSRMSPGWITLLDILLSLSSDGRAARCDAVHPDPENTARGRLIDRPRNDGPADRRKGP
jgi:hypothetical protein